ncbi:hypothetical protein [Pseudochrobactrum sp. B5]|uniref:hypothetical protein n=1 Tax=Pseudochrobactrum sp. B5 TaxID=1289478 RepID=UPI00095252E7|nr:hypothetical protein [Pseudochrobactrum sp. B5]
MTGILNHIPIPFFERVPTRAKKVVCSAFEGIIDKSWTVEIAYRFLTTELTVSHVDVPDIAEFTEWYWRVRNGEIEHPQTGEGHKTHSTPAIQHTCGLFMHNVNGMIIPAEVTVQMCAKTHHIHLLVRERTNVAEAACKGMRLALNEFDEALPARVTDLIQRQ